MSDDVSARLEDLTLSIDSYDSDSESESELNYNPFSNFLFEDDGQEYLVFFRGIHFFPTKFKSKDDRKGFFEKSRAGVEIRSESVDRISFDNLGDRNHFFVLYKNQYDNFIEQYEKNRVISTTELIEKAFKYGYASNGYIADKSTPLNPSYDENGRPHRPYLGALYVILISREIFNDLDKFSYLNEHIKNEYIKYEYEKKQIKSIDSHKFQDHEIAFLNVIPGEFVYMVLPIRVPNFSKPYKEAYHRPKYGFSLDEFETFKTSSEDGKIEPIIKFIIKHKSKEVLTFLKDQQIKFGYEAPDGTFLKVPSRVGCRNIKKVRAEYKRAIEKQLVISLLSRLFNSYNPIYLAKEDKETLFRIIDNYDSFVSKDLIDKYEPQKKRSADVLDSADKIDSREELLRILSEAVKNYDIELIRQAAEDSGREIARFLNRYVDFGKQPSLEDQLGSMQITKK
jgi:hypothetical protein